MNTILNELNILSFAVAPVFYKLLYMSVAALCIGVVIMLVRRFADGKISPFWKCAMWLLVLICLVIPYRPQSNTAILNNVERLQDISYRQEYNRIRTERHDFNEVNAPTLENQIEFEQLKKDIKTSLLKSLIADVIIPMTWLAGLVIFALFLLISRIRLSVKLRSHRLAGGERYMVLLEKCKAQLGIKANVEVILQDYIGSPALLGILYPKIILPAFVDSMSDENIEYIMFHELSHFKRLDMPLNLLLIALQTVYWFNPLVWVMFKFIRQDMELANDAYVLNHIGSEHQKQYSISLIEVLTRYRGNSLAPKLLCMVDGKENMERRIKMIKLGEVFKKRRLVIAVVSLVIICACGAVFLTTRPSYLGETPPPMYAHITGSSRELILGTYSWSYKDTNVESDSPIYYELDYSDRDTLKYRVQSDPIIVYISTAKIFQVGEDNISAKALSIKRYNPADKTEVSIVDYSYNDSDITFLLANEPGIYFYEVHLEFDNGNAYYGLKVDVGDGIISSATETYAKSLYKNKTEYVGNSSKVGGIISNLRVQSRFEYNSFELFTKEAPYGMAINYTIGDEYGKYLSERITALYFEKYALILFSLIENVEYINVNVAYGGKEQISLWFNRKDIEAALGLNLHSFAADEVSFRGFISDVTSGRLALTKMPEISTFKGLELYVWKNKELTGSDDIYFTLLPGTNRNKSLTEIYDLGVATKDIDDIRSIIAKSVDGLHLFIYQLNDYDFTKEKMDEYLNALLVIAPDNYSASIGIYTTDISSLPKRFTIESSQYRYNDSNGLFYEDANYRYYAQAVYAEDFLVRFEDGTSLALPEALNSGKISIDELVHCENVPFNRLIEPKSGALGDVYLAGPHHFITFSMNENSFVPSVTFMAIPKNGPVQYVYFDLYELADILTQNDFSAHAAKLREIGSFSELPVVAGKTYIKDSSLIELGIGVNIDWEVSSHMPVRFSINLSKPEHPLTFWIKPDEPTEVLGRVAAEQWLKSYTSSEGLSGYNINNVKVISVAPNADIALEDMQYVVQVDYDITSYTDSFVSPSDGISGKGTFKNLYRELYLKWIKDGGSYEIEGVGIEGGKQEFLISEMPTVTE